MIKPTLVLTPRGLYGAAAVLFLGALALRLVPASLPPADPSHRVPVAVTPVQVPARTGDVSTYAAIGAGNVFARTRRPPAVRFVPEGREPPAAAAPAPIKRRQPVFRLYGITVGARGAVALIDADPKIRGAELYRVGDLVGGAPITGITDSTVVIARKGARLVLRLPPAQRPRS